VRLLHDRLIIFYIFYIYKAAFRKSRAKILMPSLYAQAGSLQLTLGGHQEPLGHSFQYPEYAG